VCALLERDEALAALEQSLVEAGEQGRLVAVSGEAGIGKSALLEEFARRHRHGVDFLRGGCEALRTPSPLCPLFDMAADLGQATVSRLRASVPDHELFAAFLEDLAGRKRPVVVLFEDVHWADEATLDLLQFVGRRIGRTSALLIVTWRDDQVDLDHAIHRMLGGWHPEKILRIRLEPLSIDAVTQLAAGSRDAGALHRLTGGNPFFVTEALGSSLEAMPVAVSEAVLARRAALNSDARAVLDFVSIVPSATEYALLEAAVQPGLGGIEACIAAGLLKSDPHAIVFRHELARLAVMGALPPVRARGYHRLVLQALLEKFDRSSVLDRIVHHAKACGALDIIEEYAPAAARQASMLGDHRQAVEHCRLALEHLDRLSDDEKAGLIESCSYEYYVTGEMDLAREGRQEALALWKRLEAPLGVGRNIRWLSKLAWVAGDRAEAEIRANEALAVLSRLSETEELAMAYSNQSQLDMNIGNLESCIAWGTRSIELARRLKSTEVLSHALNNVGSARIAAGDRSGFAQLEESLDLALAGDLHEHAARAFTNLASSEIAGRNYAAARTWLERGISYTAERDLNSWGLYLIACRARLNVETGSWEDACRDAEIVIAAPRTASVSRILALTSLGLVQVRRGDACAAGALEEALALARPIREPERLVPIVVARAELAWLSGKVEEISRWISVGLEALPSEGPSADREILDYWLWRVGGSSRNITGGDGPYALQVRGEWQAAAAFWSSKGCLYEQAQALMEGDLDAAKRALEIFQTLGAAPAATLAQQRLRQLGAGRLPRGRRPSTRVHPAGLTRREGEILALLAAGLRNPQIADRLFVSRKTVEHHVSSILGKLEVSSREAAVARAKAEGWVD
jgi:DNA-binding CsgD family transcriptional regulator/tetratricopeptide (TPR) repeat protein